MSAQPVWYPAVQDAPFVVGGVVIAELRIPGALRGLAVLCPPGKRKLKMSVLRKMDFLRRLFSLVDVELCSHASLFQNM